MRLFSTTNVKAVNPITKLHHVKLDLPRLLQPNMVPLIRQNIINRKANYADIDAVLRHYEHHRTL